jgi:hypothetical protein
MADSTTPLDQISTNTANNEVRVNETFDAASPGTLFGRRASTTTGLTWGYYGGRLGGTAIASGTVTLVNGTNRVVALRSTGVVSASTTTTNWNNTAEYMRLHTVVAASSQVSSYEDHRLGVGGVFSAGSLGRHMIWVPARNMSPSATGGCAALATIASSANQPDIQTLDFDTTTQEFAQFSIAMPKRWNLSTITFAPIWSHASTATNFGVVWQLQGLARGDDDAIATAYGTAVTSTDTGGTTNDLYVGPESAAITIAGTPAAEDVVFFRIARVPANGSDTLAIDARLHGVRLYINTTAENDA